MQEYIRRLALALIIIVLVFVGIGFTKQANAADYSQYKELFMLNKAGGVIAVTLEPCAIPDAIKAGFENRGYATESNGTKHEGCWAAPDISEAPRHPGVRIIPIVNMWFDGEVVSLPQDDFKPIAPEIEGAL